MNLQKLINQMGLGLLNSFWCMPKAKPLMIVSEFLNFVLFISVFFFDR
jgi:hypothetical protein